MNPRFYFATCQVGAEKVVKAEVVLYHPSLCAAFSRPGFVTFKDAAPRGPALQLENGVFTRLWGEVLGHVNAPVDLPVLLASVPLYGALQAFDRDQYAPGGEPPDFSRNSHIISILKKFPGWNEVGASTMECAGNKGVRASSLRIGQLVYSIIWIDDDAIFLGCHNHADRLCAAPGNILDIRLPPHAPSRAYLKIEEAFQRFGPPPEKGQTVLEIGCAPGGATMAMLDRELMVIGIDPQHMASAVQQRQGFRAIRKAARFVVADDLQGVNPDFLVMDMSIPPLDAIAELSHVLRLLRTVAGKDLRLSRAYLTLKLNNWKFAEDIPLYLQRLEQAGFSALRAIQLCSNRQEFFVYSGSFE
jgi:23S rRNA (cytidine2498-2'-O)-methyltransferase